MKAKVLKNPQFLVILHPYLVFFSSSLTSAGYAMLLMKSNWQEVGTYLIHD